jgi:DNA-binding NarL/FixJ family response regulator
MSVETEDRARTGGSVDLRPNLIVVSSVRFLRDTLFDVLARNGAFAMAGQADSLPAAAVLCRAGRPDLILLDASFPGGHRAVMPLREIAPTARVVAFAVVETAENIVGWAQAGAAGYVPATAALDDLSPMLLGIHGGRQPCSSDVAAGLLRRIAEARAPSPTPLTARERQIAGLIAAGLSNKDIARELDIGLATTKSHVHNLLAKLNVRRRGQAAGRIYDRFGDEGFRSSRIVGRQDAAGAF